VAIGTPVHARTSARCTSLNYREWAGYHAVSAYASHHEREYHAIRHAAALIDISPLYKYLVAGPDAGRLVDRVITRDVRALTPGRVCYTPWCDEDGTVLDDGTVARVEDRLFRWTAAEPALRWLRQNAAGLDVTIDDVSSELAALAVQGPEAARVLRATASNADIDALAYYRTTPATMAGAAIHVSRTGYTGDLGYELWIPAADALRVWDALVEAGRRFDLEPAGLLALDVARIEAGLLLIGVDYHGSRAALSASQRYTPYEMGLGRLVHLDKGPFVGRDALRRAHDRGPARRIVGLEVDWPAVEALFERAGLPPTVPTTASRTAVPVRSGRRQVGRATSSTWSPVLKRFLALATVDAGHAQAGTTLGIEVTVDAVRHFVGATVVPTPFFKPERRTRTPPP
jgi:aminomethyltransferase